MLYSKNGSIPKPQTDGTEGWIEVPEAPVAPEGKEVVWWSPPGWVVRPIKPSKDGFDYSWSQSEEKWVEHELVASEPVDVVISGASASTVASADAFTLSSGNDSISLDFGTASDTITISGEPT